MTASCLLAIAIMLNPAFGSYLQDTGNSGSGATQTAPPAAPAPAETGKDAADDATRPPDLAPEPAKEGQFKAGNPTERSTKTTRQKRGRKRDAPPTEDSEPRKIVIRHGSAAEPTAQIIPNLSIEEAAKERESAQELLVSADTNLKTLATRVLDAPKLATMTQIRNYMEKARSALQDGDVRRAHILALKAHLLADDLAKH